jgi:hypothetical protein
MDSVRKILSFMENLDWQRVANFAPSLAFHRPHAAKIFVLDEDARQRAYAKRNKPGVSRFSVDSLEAS